MLVLTRKVDESIIIGDDINIKILALSGSQVKIGISAPRSLRILRKEVYDEIVSGQRKDTSSGGAEADHRKGPSGPDGPSEGPSGPETKSS
ncbi:MAG: carbon storage regulator CsrA [Planctomycetes bacterium]|nr:carbon storage regulator CsrA [Planctomycetota bacterium]